MHDKILSDFDATFFDSFCNLFLASFLEAKVILLCQFANGGGGGVIGIVCVCVGGGGAFTVAFRLT